jgi:HPt (histidine-containing phosphotransfer) domain-containing protein
MNTYERLLSSLEAEFKKKAPPQFRSLWADVMELEEAPDERRFSKAHDHALQRIHALGCAARAAGAHPVPALSRSLELKLRVLTRTHATAHPESVEALHRTMNQLAEALYSSDNTALVPENIHSPTETSLVESCAD